MSLLRVFIVIMLFSFQAVTGYNYTASNNPYLTKLEDASDNESRVSMMREYVNLYHNSNDSITRTKVVKALEFIDYNYPQGNYPLGIYRVISTEYYVQKNYPKYLEYSHKLIMQCVEGKDDYFIYSTYYSIGLANTHLENYQQALDNFSKSVEYFQKHLSDYNHLLGYINAKRYQAICAFYLKNNTLSEQYLNEGYNLLNKLNPEDYYYDVAYYNLIKGMNLYVTGSYTDSEHWLQNTLIPIQKNEDFANEALAYKYLGLNAIENNQIDKAIGYFRKIDNLYDLHHYSSPQLVDVYKYFINYYKIKSNLEQQLAYTNKQLTIINFLHNNNKYTQEVLHNTFDVFALKKEKQRLEKELKNKKQNLYTSWFIATSIVILLIVFSYTFYKRQKKQKAIVANGNQTEKVKSTDKSNISRSVKEDIKSKLLDFENNELYLKEKISIDYLAKQLDTNRTYLSAYLHEHRGMMFSDYINNLKIEFLLKKWHEDKVWRKYKFAEIAKKLGFTSARSFSLAFSKHQNQSPTQYLKKINTKKESIITK